jgi:stage V sporulation protein R
MPQQLSQELVDLREEMKGYALGYGLDFFETIFEMVDFEEMNMVAAYGGFPNRYPHWKFGMEYEQLSKSYEYGLHKIYELVINNDPCYAYLLEGNAFVDQKLVMGHVYGHCDFFKNNFMFAHTNRRMIDEMANHGTRSRRHIEKWGHDRVENFIDMCLSIDNLIDYQSPYIQRRPTPRVRDDQPQHDVPKLKVTKSYMQDYINPKEFLESQKKKLEEQKKKEKRFPEHPERDIMLFLLENSPLEGWEQDTVAMLRDEAYYFAPQGQTKIMNEGWASYWHSTIMTNKALKASEIIDYADHHSGTMAVQPGKLNPYKLGLELWRDIEDRWNRGRFGKEYDECDDYAKRRQWDKQLGLGRKKIFEVRKHYNDVTFIDEFLTMDFVRENKMFTYMFNRKSQQWEITDRDFRRVKQKLLDSLTNFGQPIIRVVDGNFQNRGELLLEHEHDGIDLRQDYSKEVLRNLFGFWKRPVGIATRSDDRGIILRFDGQSYEEEKYEKL